MRNLAIAYGNNRQAKTWVNKTIRFADLKERLKVTIRTAESAEEYAKMSKAQRDAAKDHGGFVAGVLMGGRRKIDTVEVRSMLALDGDRIDATFLAGYESLCPYASVLYTTHSSTPDNPRVRLVFPLTRDVTPEEFVAVSRYVAQMLGIDYFDECSYQPNQLMYWPSSPQNGVFVYKETNGEWLNPDDVLSAHPEWNDPTRLPTSSRESKANAVTQQKVQDPLAKEGVVGLFNRVYYPVTKALQEFLSDVYEPTDNENRWHLKQSSSMAGVEIKEDKFVYSHHAKDPAYLKLCNAFDIVRMHRFGDKDDKASYLTCTPPTEEDGLTYMLLGIMTSAYAMNLFPEHPLYRFVNGAFQPLSQVAYEAYKEVGEVRTEMRTAIEQTNTAIALKADQTTVTALSSRVDSAEQQITPEAITSKVLRSAQYAFEKADGRNYCLNSAVEHKFVDGYYRLASGGTTTATGQRLDLSDDFFSHSNGLSRMLFSFDIKRTNIDASAASTAGVYSGFWIYYNLYGADGTTVSTTGRGFYLRTSDANFAATDSDWVHMTYGVYNFSGYNPISVAYAYIGTASQKGCTGTVEFRNFKVETSETWTDWSAAPEDIYGLSSRMSNAESRITQNASSIALKVSTSTYNSEKVYRGSTAPTTLYTNMLWLDTSVSPNLLKRYTGSTWVAAGAQEVKASGITIGPNNVAITTENFLLQLLDPGDNENVLMEMSANGNVGFKQLYADEVISDSVAQSYAGSSRLWVEPSIETPTETDFRSLGEAVQTLNNRFLPNDVTIYLPWGWETYEPSGVVIRGISGPGKLTIYGYGENSILNSYIKVHGCFAHICFQNLYLRESRTLNGSNRQPYLCEVTKCHFVEFSGCTLDANGITYDSVYARSSHVFLYNCGLYNALQGLECYLAQGNVKNCCGSCSWAMVSYASLIIASGTVPAGSRGTGENGLLYANSVTTDYGTAIPTVTPDETGILYATTTKSWRGSWRTDTLDVIQGVYYDSGYNSSLNWNRGCMWFSNAQNLLSGCTVKSATLTLHRKTGSGSSSAKSVYLCAITNTSASGTPSIARNYGAIGTIGRDKQVTFSIPVDAVQGLADGYYGGLCLYETPYNFGSSTYSNAYMRMSGTDTNYEPYIECVFSVSTAVG